MADPITVALGASFAPWVGWWGVWAALAARAALAPSRREPGAGARLDVVIPAHDEEATLPTLLASIGAQRTAFGHVLVVADHCRDDTAGVARRHGVDVIERDGGDPGKPPALRDGIAWLRARPDRGDAVVILDADCECDPGFTEAVSARLVPDVDVVQAAYTLVEPGEGVRAGLRRGFALRNVVRAEGADRLGIPNLLVGSGIVLRWDVLDHLAWHDPRIGGTGDTRPVADDVSMTLDLLEAGVHARFAAGASVVAPVPGDEQSLGAQRLRWEAGQALMWRRAPRVATTLARRGDVRGLLALADWLAPPLAPSVVAFGGLTAVTTLAVASGFAGPAVLAAPAMAAAALAAYLGIGISLLEGPGAVIDTALGAPRFVAWKARLYLGHRAARRPGAEHRAGVR